MKNNIPTLTQSDIQEWVGEISFRKGMSYSQQGAIFDPCRQGMVLKAQCHGSSAPSYDVEATLNDEGIAQADCSCPVGGWGTCKHVAALLLTWIYNPDAFREIEDLETSLERRN